MHGGCFSAYFVFVTDGRTDTMCENNDHLIGRGLVGQKIKVHPVTSLPVNLQFSWQNFWFTGRKKKILWRRFFPLSLFYEMMIEWLMVEQAEKKQYRSHQWSPWPDATVMPVVKIICTWNICFVNARFWRFEVGRWTINNCNLIVGRPSGSKVQTAMGNRNEKTIRGYTRILFAVQEKG